MALNGIPATLADTISVDWIVLHAMRDGSSSVSSLSLETDGTLSVTEVKNLVEASKL